MRIALPDRIDPASFARRDQHAPVVTLSGETMGTTWRVLYARRDVDAGSLRAAIVARLDAIVAEFSHWSPTSRLSRFNAAPAGSWHVVPPEFAAVVRTAIGIATASDGAFDPAIGALIDLWGFGPPGPMPAPPPAAIATARARSGIARLRWDEPTARLYQPGGVQLDLSGIAKGHAVDMVADLLAAHGIADALVEVGGELVGRGIRPDGEPWWVDLETPPGRAVLPLRLGLHELAVATSGNYRRGDHNLDPRTGRPADTAITALTVIADTAIAADAWATALLVAGPDAAAQLAAAHRLAVRWITPAGERISSALRDMLDG